MAQDHAGNLEKTQAQLIERRRSLAETLAAGYDQERAEELMMVLQAIELLLEAIDEENARAAEAMKPAPPKSRR